MSSYLNPYLHFRNNAREAMDFYKSIFGGDLQIMPFGDMAHAAEEKNLVMHSALTAPNGMLLMGADTPASMDYKPAAGMTVSLSGDDEAELTGYWNGLAKGATVSVPLAKAPWGDSFGMLTDRFGIPWLVNISARRG